MNFQEQISEQQIERSLWLIQNKPLIKKIIIIFLFLIILGLYGFSLLTFINIKISDSKNESFVNGLEIDFTNWKIRNKIEDLKIINKNIISLGDNKYDIVIEIRNPNQKNALTQLKYKFIYDNQESEEKTTFLLPQQNKKLIDFNVESNKIIRDVDIEIIDTNWQRLSFTEIQKLPSEIFKISNQEMHFNNENNARNWIEFKATNNSPYNWKETQFYVSLYLGSKMVAINQVKTDNFYSLESKNLKASWFQKIPAYVTFEIEGETNLLNPENYINPR